jgi:hypothetical protein
MSIRVHMESRQPQSTWNSIPRRSWLLSALAGWASASVKAEGNDVLDAIRTRGRNAGLAAFGINESDHFSVIGDAPEVYRREILDVCKSLANSYQAHFREKGFTISLPKQPFILVVLSGPRSYAAFLGEDPGPAVGGHYDREENYLVTFEFRQNDRRTPVPPERINTRTLAHETTHLLSFNTGPLDRHGDVPLCISEGLGTYAETWRPRGLGHYGQVNRYWLEVFALDRRRIKNWVPIPKLIADDDLFDKEQTRNIAYAESWATVKMLLSTKARLPPFRRYLETIRLRRAPAERVKDFRDTLGDLDELDREVKQYAETMIRKL